MTERACSQRPPRGPNWHEPKLLWRLPAPAGAEEIVRLCRLRRRIEEVFRALKSDAMRLEKTQMQEAGRLYKLALVGLAAATRASRLVNARDASKRPATDGIDAALPPKPLPQLPKARPRASKPPIRARRSPGSGARLGGWNCHYKPPGPKTTRAGWAQFAAIATGFFIAITQTIV
jgi:hypothetical protein